MNEFERPDLAEHADLADTRSIGGRFGGKTHFKPRFTTGRTDRPSGQNIGINLSVRKQQILRESRRTVRPGMESR